MKMANGKSLRIQLVGKKQRPVLELVTREVTIRIGNVKDCAYQSDRSFHESFLTQGRSARKAGGNL